MKKVIKRSNAVALCSVDADERRLRASRLNFPKLKTFALDQSSGGALKMTIIQL